MSSPYVPTLSHPPTPVTSTQSHIHTLSATSGTVPERVYLNNRAVRLVNVYGFSAIAANGQPTNNGGNIFTGWRGDATPDIISPGGQLTYRMDPGEQKDLNDLRVSGTTGDGVYVEWEEFL